MKIRILGNGGAINDGLPYNSFMVDDFFLVEVPPDIMTSLFREKVKLSGLKAIYISHFHGDHCFGLPFLLLRIFFNSEGRNYDYKIKIIGPENVKQRTKELCILALGRTHPVNNWIEDNFIFIDLSAGSRIDAGNGISLEIFFMDHLVETYGFSAYRNDRITFSYFADTLWSDELLSQIKLFPEIIITDLNGEQSDPEKIHMSEKDLFENAIPYGEGKIVFYGTHLKTQKESSHEKIKYVHPGESILLK